MILLNRESRDLEFPVFAVIITGLVVGFGAGKRVIMWDIVNVHFYVNVFLWSPSSC